jgi:hypothetical protein
MIMIFDYTVKVHSMLALAIIIAPFAHYAGAVDA